MECERVYHPTCILKRQLISVVMVPNNYLIYLIDEEVSTRELDHDLSRQEYIVSKRFYVEHISSRDLVSYPFLLNLWL